MRRGNSIAMDLGIRSTEEGLEAVVRGGARPVDVCNFTQNSERWCFINLIGFGFVTDIARTAHRLKRFGALSYVLGAFHRLLCQRFCEMELEIDGLKISGRNWFVEFCNSRYTGGKMLMVS